MVFSPDGRYLASASSDAVVCVWEPASADQVSRFDNRTSGARCVAFSPGGRYLAVADDDGGVLHSDRWTGEQVPSPARHEGPALGVTFSPDGRRLASTGRDGTVRIWDVPLPADPAPALGYDQADRPERRIAPEMPSFEMDWFSMPPFDPPTPRPGPGPRSRGVAPARSRAAAPLDILGFMRAIRDRAPRTRP
jgi:hypothetical protein